MVELEYKRFWSEDCPWCVDCACLPPEPEAYEGPYSDPESEED